jgi:hypothetical protein
MYESFFPALAVRIKFKKESINLKFNKGIVSFSSFDGPGHGEHVIALEKIQGDQDGECYTTVRTEHMGTVVIRFVLLNLHCNHECSWKIILW